MSGEQLEAGETELDPNAIVFRNQRKQFLNQFAVTFNLPGNHTFIYLPLIGFIIHQSQLYPKDHQYFISSERYSFPDVRLMTV
jgi:hypothetical protein